MGDTVPEAPDGPVNAQDPLVELLALFAQECGWMPDQTLEHSLDALELLAQSILRHKIDWVMQWLNAIFGKESKKDRIASTLKKLDTLKMQGLVEDD